MGSLSAVFLLFFQFTQKKDCMQAIKWVELSKVKFSCIGIASEFVCDALDVAYGNGYLYSHLTYGTLTGRAQGDTCLESSFIGSISPPSYSDE